MPLKEAIFKAGPRPEDDAPQAAKKNYAERLSNEVALTIAEVLRNKGFKNCCPDPLTGGREKQFPGGLGAKKVDVSFSNDTAGLLLGISIKSINFADGKTGNYRKNLTNRRGDMMFEATTLHMRFPYAVLGGLILLHEGALSDTTGKARTTFQRTHYIYRTFNHRASHTDAPEKFEHLAIAIYRDDPVTVDIYPLGDETHTISLDEFLDSLGNSLAERNPDHFEYLDGQLTKA
jgi:hypothetical protein